MLLRKFSALLATILTLCTLLLPVHAVQEAPILSPEGVLTIGPDAPAEDRFFESDGWLWDGDTLTLSSTAGGRVRAIQMSGGTIRLTGSLALNTAGLDDSFGYALVNSSSDPVTILAGSHTLTLTDSTSDSPCLALGPLTVRSGTLDIQGSAESDIVLAGSSACLSAEQIGVTELCSVTLRKGSAQISGSVGHLSVYDGRAQVGGHVLGDLTVQAGTVTVTGTVEGACSVLGGSVLVNGQSVSPNTSQNDPSAPSPDPVPTHTHDWAQTWSGSETHHWHECLAADCPITAEEEKEGYVLHSGGTATCMSWAVCTQCGMEYGQLGGHVYDQADPSEPYLLTPATHSAPAVYLMSCVCAQAGTQTFSVGQPLDHTFSQQLIWDESGHWQQCDCGETQSFYPHTSDQSCTVCGYTVPDPPSGDHSGDSSGVGSDVPAGDTSGTVSDVPSGDSSGAVSDIPSGDTSGAVSDVPSGDSSGAVSDIPSGDTSGAVSDVPSGDSSGAVSDIPSGDTSGAVSDVPSGGSSGDQPSAPSTDHSDREDTGSQLLMLDVIMYGSALAALALLAFVAWITFRPKRP